MVFSFHCSLHYDTECGLGEDEYLKTFSEARNQDILGKDQMKQRSAALAWLQPPEHSSDSFHAENFNT